MRVRSLTLALSLALASASASATDLLEVYQMARNNDPVISAAQSQSLSQQEGAVQARALLLPQLNADATYSKGSTDSDGTQIFGSVPFPSNSTNDATSKSWSLTLRQTIFDGAQFSRFSAGKLRANQAEADYAAAEHNLFIRVADAYFNVLTGIETLASSRAEEQAVKRQLDQAETRLEVGLAPITDVHDARARYDSARANTIASQNQLDDYREALAEITGSSVHGIRGLSAEFQPTHEDTLGVDAWVNTALQSNPSLLSKELALAAANKDLAAARSGHLPTLSASASYRDNSNNGDNTNNLIPPPNVTAYQNGSEGGSIGLTLTVPLYSGGATQSRVRQAIYNRDTAADQFEQERRSVTRQTRGALRSLQSGEAEVEARRLAVVSAQAAYEAGETGLEVGTRTIVDVLIAQQQLFQAQREYARARHSFLVNQLRLKQASGTLDINDLQAVNRALVNDAEQVLDQTQ